MSDSILTFLADNLYMYTNYIESIYEGLPLIILPVFNILRLG